MAVAPTYGPTTQNNLSPNTVSCDGGLDLISPKISVNAGSLNGCLNFERNDRVGYSRVMGYEPFDGGGLASLCYTNLAYVIHSDPGDVLPPPRDAVWIINDDSTAAPVLGFVADSDHLQTIIAVTSFDQWRRVLAAVAASDTIVLGTFSGATLTVSDTKDFATYWQSQQSGTVTAADELAEMNNLFIGMRDTVTWPGEGDKPVIGLHGYKDQLYAIKDLRVLTFTTGAHQVRSDDTIRPNGAGDDTHAFTVLDVQLQTGTWGGGDAAGILLTDSQVALVAGAYEIELPTSLVHNALHVTGVSTDDAYFAGMWRSNTYEQSVADSVPQGWESVSLGYTMGFDDGQTTGPFQVARRGTFSSFDTDVISTAGFGTVGSTSDSTDGIGNPTSDSWSLVNAATVPIAVGGPTITKYAHRVFDNNLVNTNYIPGNLYISDFPAFSGFSGASSLDVQGIQVDVIARPTVQFDQSIRTFSVAVQPVTGDTSLLAGTSPQTLYLAVDFNNPANNTPQTLTYGSPTELWGLDAADMKAAMDTGWGFAVQPWVSHNSTGRYGIIDLIEVQVTVYYKATVSQYYFYNGSDDLTADITGFFVSSGDWSTDDAAGTLQVTNVQPYLTADRRTILSGDQVRTDPAGAGLLIATITDDMTFNGLDPLNELVSHNSRYEIITANFYADAEFESMYGVSGAGRAWSYDGFYFDRIFTQADGTKDMPRHILNHQFHLALGYDSGAVLLSALGNPQDFSGVDGSAEIDTGDPVIGFSRMQGTTLGVFCKKSVQSIVGTSIDNFSLSVLGPYEGAIEYTIIDVGGRPVYCSYRGIGFFDQTNAYGDFAGSRLSVPVSPWLLPRLQGTVPPLGVAGASYGPVCAIACRTKNQYRLLFQDGAQLTLTLVNSDQEPQFTFQNISLYEAGVWKAYLVPRAETSFVDSKGTEHIYLGHYSESAPPPNNQYFVYEFERSWTFDGYGIPAYIILNENFYGSIFDVDTIHTVRAEGMSHGYAPLSYIVKNNYSDNSDANQPANRVVSLSMPHDPASLLSYQLMPTTSMSTYKKRGRSFNYRFMSYNTTNTPATSKEPQYADISPPFVIQGLLVQITENKGDGNAS